jgi:hypothetical protein
VTKLEHIKKRYIGKSIQKEMGFGLISHTISDVHVFPVVLENYEFGLHIFTQTDDAIYFRPYRLQVLHELQTYYNVYGIFV